MFDVWSSRAHCSGMPCAVKRVSVDTQAFVTVDKQSYEKEQTARTHSELPCDSIKSNMYGVFKVWRRWNLWSFLVSVFLSTTWRKPNAYWNCIWQHVTQEPREWKCWKPNVSGHQTLVKADYKAELSWSHLDKFALYFQHTIVFEKVSIYLAKNSFPGQMKGVTAALEWAKATCRMLEPMAL